jgi:hypothetical protein
MDCRGPGFLAVVLFGSFPLSRLPPSITSASCLSFLVFLCVARRESLVLYNQLTTLWKTGVFFVDDVYPYQGPDKEQLDEKAGSQNPHGDTPTKYCRQVRQVSLRWDS